MNKYINKNINITITCSAILISLYAHSTPTDLSTSTEDTNHQLTQSGEKTNGKITSFLLNETNPSNTFTLPSIPGLPLPDSINNQGETSFPHSTPTILGKRNFPQLQQPSQQDAPISKTKKRKTPSASYGHLSKEQKKSIRQYIQTNPNAKGEEISQYATDRLGFELSTAAAGKFKRNTATTPRSYGHLTDEQRESLKQYIQDNPNAKGKDISQYATDQLRVKLSNVAAGFFKNNIAITSQSYGHLTSEQKESIKKFIKANPDAKGKEISQYATDQLRVKLSTAAAGFFKNNIAITSQSYGHLTSEQKESIKKFIKANPDANAKEISQYATDRLGVELSNVAAGKFKRNTATTSQSYSHLTDEQRESIKQYIQDNPNAKGKEISQYAIDRLGVELNKKAAGKFKSNTTANPGSYGHLTDEQRESLKQYIQDNPNATGKDISQYATDQLRVKLSTAAAGKFKSNTATTTRSYGHLTDEQRESLKQYIQDNPNAKGKDISQYATNQLGVALSTAAAGLFKNNIAITSQSYDHLTSEQKESIKKFITANPNATGKDISQYATDQLGVELNNKAAGKFKRNVTFPSLSYSHLTDEQKESIKQYIQDNPDAKGKDISHYATNQLGVELSNEAASKFKRNTATTSQSYSHLTNEQRESLKQYIQDNPDAKGKDISQYATNQLGVELNNAAAGLFKYTIAITSQSYGHLTDEHRESIKQYIQDNPDAKGKDISQYATNQLGVELNKKAAGLFKRNASLPSRSYGHLTDEQREDLKQYIQDNPDAKGKDISQYATNQLGVELNKEAAGKFKSKITYMMITKK